MDEFLAVGDGAEWVIVAAFDEVAAKLPNEAAKIVAGIGSEAPPAVRHKSKTKDEMEASNGWAAT